MCTIIKTPTSYKRVDLILQDTTHPLTREDILEIAEIAEQAQAALHISDLSCQLLVGIPEVYRQEVSQAIRALGYEGVWLDPGVGEEILQKI